MTNSEIRAWQIRYDARMEARSMMEIAAEIEDLRVVIFASTETWTARLMSNRS